MNNSTLKKANDLDKKIKEYSEALNCFEYQFEKDLAPISTNPRLIIEFDGGDDRETLPIPMKLSDLLISIIKDEIIKGRDRAIAEFDLL